MNTYGSKTKASMWLMAALAAGVMGGCGSGDGGQIFGSGGSSSNPGPAGAGPALGAAAPFGGLSGGAAGMTNTGVDTVINGGDMGTTATNTVNVTGFHDSAGDIYTETGANIGNVTGLIFTCTTSTTGPTAAVVNAASCATATQGAADALAAWNDLSPASRPGATDPGANLSGLTLAPGIYATAGGAFLLDAADLTLDAGGNADAVWVFQTASTLTVGAAASSTSVILTGGAQAKNVFWHIGSAATINPNGGGTMVGTIISSAATTFSTVGIAAITTLNGRAAALNAAVTLNNTVINVPAP